MKPDDMRQGIIDFIEQMFAVEIHWELFLMLFLFLFKALENITVMCSFTAEEPGEFRTLR